MHGLKNDVKRPGKLEIFYVVERETTIIKQCLKGSVGQGMERKDKEEWNRNKIYK